MNLERQLVIKMVSFRFLPLLLVFCLLFLIGMSVSHIVFCCFEIQLLQCLFCFVFILAVKNMCHLLGNPS